MTNRKVIVLLWVVLLTFFLPSKAWSKNFYFVKKGDTLSSIAFKELGSPVYSKKKGSLAKLILMNPQIKNPHWILPGTRISILNRTALSTKFPLVKLPTLKKKFVADIRAPASEKIEIAPPTNDVIPLSSPPRRYSQVELSTRFFYSRLFATDSVTRSNGEYLSNINRSFSGKWVQTWSAFTRTYFGVGLTQVDYQTPRGRLLDGSMGTFTDFSLGLKSQLSPKLTLGLDQVFGQEQFIRSVTTTKDSIDPVMIPKTSLSANYDLLLLEPFVVGLRMAATYLWGATTANGYSVNPGAGWNAGIFLSQDLAFDWRLTAEVDYKTQNQSTTISAQNYSELGWFLGLLIPIGGSKK